MQEADAQHDRRLQPASHAYVNDSGITMRLFLTPRQRCEGDAMFVLLWHDEDSEASLSVVREQNWSGTASWLQGNNECDCYVPI